jgi:HEAT repeat protein
VRALGDEDPAIRRGAAAIVGYVPGDPGDVVADLSRALADPSPDVARAAAEIARRLGERAAPLTEPLTALVRGADAGARDAAVRALAAVGPGARDAAPTLLAALPGAPPALAVEALGALARVAPADAAVLEAMRTARRSTSPEVRVAAVDGLAGCARADPTATDEFLVTFGDRSPRVRMRAVAAVSRVPADALTQAAIPELVNALVDDEGAVRAVAHAAVGTLGEQMVPYVKNLLEVHERDSARSPLPQLLSRWRSWVAEPAMAAYPSAGPRVREAVAMHLLRGDPPRAGESAAGMGRALLAELVGTLPTSDRQRSRHLLSVLASKNPRTLDAFFEAFRGDDEAAATAAAQALQGLAHARPGLRDLLRDERPAVRRRAANALSNGNVGEEEREPFSSLLRDADPGVRRAAAFGLVRSGFASGRRAREEADAVALTLLGDVLVESLGAEDVKVRWQAATFLGNLGDLAKERVPRLREALGDADATVVRAAAEAIRKVAAASQMELVTAVLPALSSDDPRLRAGGALVLALAGGHQRAVLTHVEPLLGHRDAAVRIAALGVVVVLGPDAGLLVVRLDELTRDPDPRVVAAAQSAVEALRREPNASVRPGGGR